MSGFSTKDTLVFEKTVDVPEETKCCGELLNVYDLEKCAAWINKHEFQRVCLQFPDQMLCDSAKIASYINSSTSAVAYILADTSYGSCCVDCIAASHVDADALIHFGPACLSPHIGLPVLYIYDVGVLDVSKLVRTLAEVANVDYSLILFYDTSFHKFYPALYDAFSGMDQVIVSSIEETPSDDENYQTICGRTFRKLSDNVQGVYIGADSITLTNLVLRMPVMKWYNYDKGELHSYNFQTNKFLMKRLHLVEKVKDAQAVGIVVATLAVQNYLSAVERIKSLCKATGKRCYTLAVGRPNVAKLANFPEIDVYVVVSCMESSLLLNRADFYKPLVTLFEVELALGGRPWSSNYSLDFRQLLPGGDLHVAPENCEATTEGGDISLVSGKIRHMTAAEPVFEDEGIEGAVNLRDAGTIVESRAAEFLSQRSWGGLEQKIGETPVEKAKQGRSGVPIGYSNEGL